MRLWPGHPQRPPHGAPRNPAAFESEEKHKRRGGMEKRGAESKHARGQEGRGRLLQARVPRHAQPCDWASHDVSEWETPLSPPRILQVGNRRPRAGAWCSGTRSTDSEVTLPALPRRVPVPVLPPHLLAFACAGSPCPGVCRLPQEALLGPTGPCRLPPPASLFFPLPVTALGLRDQPAMVEGTVA